MNKYIYLCEDSPEGIFSAVYRAYEDRHGHSFNELRINKPGFNRELFCEYITVETDFDCASKVARTIQNKISYEAYEFVHRTAVSCVEEKADAIYRFIIHGLTMGNQVLQHLTVPFMQILFSIDRTVCNEIYHWKEFLRFQELRDGSLFARINPKSDLLPYLAEHFSDRYSCEDWIIADTVHRTVLFHFTEKYNAYETKAAENQFTGNLPTGIGSGLPAVHLSGGCLYASMEEVDFDQLELLYSEEEEDMQRLWKLFVDTIAIKERKNDVLQRQLLPLWFRKYMKEY